MSEIKVNKITPRTDCGTTQLGDSGDTVTVTGDLRSDSLKAADGGVIISQSGTNITIGASGDTISLASGASQSGFGREGSVDWQTGSLKTSTFTAASGEGYFINSGSAITMNLPAGTAGAIVAVSDYARNFSTYNLTISPNGSQKIGGVADDAKLSVDGQAATFVYVDDTKGWINVQNAEDTFTGAPPFITATGGTVTTVCSNFKVHTFTGPGTFQVTSTSNTPTNNQVDYLVVAGGASGGTGNSGSAAGGGAGGLRFSAGTWCAPSPVAPRAGSMAPVTLTSYPITVGAGASGQSSNGLKGNCGSASSFSTFPAAGGGGGGGHCATDGKSGGSGGGGATGSPTGVTCGGAGNTPPVSPSQGNPGGASGPHAPNYIKGGGGGAGAAGVAGNPPTKSGCGGAGLQVNINGANHYWAGGGASSAWQCSSAGAGDGGIGGGGGGTIPSSGPASPGTGGGSALNSGGTGVKGGATGAGGTNTGGGGASQNANNSPATSGAGGSGIVIIRYRFQ